MNQSGEDLSQFNIHIWHRIRISISKFESFNGDSISSSRVGVGVVDIISG